MKLQVKTKALWLRDAEASGYDAYRVASWFWCPMVGIVFGRPFKHNQVMYPETKLQIVRHTLHDDETDDAMGVVGLDVGLRPSRPVNLGTVQNWFYQRPAIMEDYFENNWHILLF